MTITSVEIMKIRTEREQCGTRCAVIKQSNSKV